MSRCSGVNAIFCRFRPHGDSSVLPARRNCAFIMRCSLLVLWSLFMSDAAYKEAAPPPHCTVKVTTEAFTILDCFCVVIKDKLRGRFLGLCTSTSERSSDTCRQLLACMCRYRQPAHNSSEDRGATPPALVHGVKFFLLVGAKGEWSQYNTHGGAYPLSKAWHGITQGGARHARR